MFNTTSNNQKQYSRYATKLLWKPTQPHHHVSRYFMNLLYIYPRSVVFLNSGIRCLKLVLVSWYSFTCMRPKQKKNNTVYHINENLLHLRALEGQWFKCKKVVDLFVRSVHVQQPIAYLNDEIKLLQQKTYLKIWTISYVPCKP